MALTRAWQESYPNDENFGYELDDYQRQIRVDVRERLAVQHKLYSDETGHSDVGEHKPGECNIAFIGAKASFPTPATSNSGCVAIATDEGNQGYYWSGSAWTKTQEPVLITGNQTIAGAKTFNGQCTFADLKASADIDIGSYKLTAQQIESDIATGTSPMVVASTTKVDNLNADKLDGFDVSAYSGGESHTFPGGLIVKFGIKAIGAISTVTVTFGEAFPNDCIMGVASPNKSSGDCYGVGVHTEIAASMKLYNYDNDAITARWIALGY